MARWQWERLGIGHLYLDEFFRSASESGIWYEAKGARELGPEETPQRALETLARSEPGVLGGVYFAFHPTDIMAHGNFFDSLVQHESWRLAFEGNSKRNPSMNGYNCLRFPTGGSELILYLAEGEKPVAEIFLSEESINRTPHFPLQDCKMHVDPKYIPAVLGDVSPNVWETNLVDNLEYTVVNFRSPNAFWNIKVNNLKSGVLGPDNGSD